MRIGNIGSMRMGDISDVIPKDSETVLAIYNYHEENNKSEVMRGYLGASIIGHECCRYLWYLFRQCCKPTFSGRMLRLLETGDLEEPRFTKELEAIGCEVHTEQNGEQYAVSAHGGHFSGHLDGCACGILEAPKTWHVLEFKTHNAKSYRELVKKGIERSKPQHFAQMQVYMHLTDMTRALYLAKNKDTDELYSERIKYCKKKAEDLLIKALFIITSQDLPQPVSGDPDSYACKWCDARELCFGSTSHGKALPISTLSCRQCCHATPKLDGCEFGTGRWVCEKSKRALTPDDQARMCDDHLVLPCLIPYADPCYGTDEDGNGFIHYKSDDIEWYNGKTKGTFSSMELTIIPVAELGNRLIKAAKNLFDAKVDGYTKDILDRYPKDCIIWEGRIQKLPEFWKEEYGETLRNMKPVNTTTLPTHLINEYSGNRIVVYYPVEKNAEIRQATKQERNNETVP